VFLGHFFGPIRAVIPVVAGMFAMPQLPFQIANATSAFIWAAGVIAPAFFLVMFEHDVLTFLRQYEAAVAVVLFLLAIANSVPRPLLFLPTLILFVGLGALHLFANGQFLPIWLAGAAGALVGDLYSYWLGGRHSSELASVWPLNGDAELVADARTLVERWGAPAVILSKFRGRDRGVVPLVAGAVRMPPVTFVLTSGLSALLWSAALLLPGLVLALLVGPTE
jgi:membrane protein DedA with SNARE-associated domain